VADKFTMLKGGRLIDGNGGDPVEDSVLVIKNDRIDAVGKEGKVGEFPQDAEVIDVSGKTVMPGLMDMHVHPLGVKSLDPLSWIITSQELRAIRASVDAWRLIDSGFTTIRDCATPTSLHLKKAVEEGSIIGPRIFSCNKIITQTAGHGDVAHFLPAAWSYERGIARVADGVDECRKAAREQLREGADFIKMCTTGGVMSEKDKPTHTQFSLDEIKAMVEEAHAFGVKAASHAQGTPGIKNALLGGVDTIEHGIFLDDEVIEMMINQGTYLIPTLAIVKAIIEGGTEAGVPQGSLDKAKRVFEIHRASFKKAYDAGVKVGLGTDYLSDPMSPMGKNAVELKIYVEVGRTPMEAIVSATKINAEVVDMGDDLGTLDKGKLADLIVVDGNPLDDISILCDKANILNVFKGGKQIPRLNID